MIPIIQHEMLSRGWLSNWQFLDILGIAQMTPGPIAINAATFVGTRIGGLLGAVIATLGSVLPSFVIVLIFAVLYRKYHNLRLVQGVLGSLQPTVVGLIATAGVSIIAHALLEAGATGASVAGVDLIAAGILVVGFILLRVCKANQILVIMGAGVVGGVAYSLLAH